MKTGKPTGFRAIRFVIGKFAAFFFLLVAIIGGTPPQAGATVNHSILVAAASDLVFVMKDLIDSFHTLHPEVQIQATFGSSGNFVNQIEHGAPYDLFLSADALYTHRLIKKGFVYKDHDFAYGVGQLVLWAPTTFPGELNKLEMKALMHPSVKKIAIANPTHAPYGRAALEVLHSYDVFKGVEDKLVRGESISQAAQYLQSQSAQMGLIALSLALSEPMQKGGTYWVIPKRSYSPLKQMGVILKKTHNLSLSLGFARFLLSPKGKGILARYGFVKNE